MEGNKTAYGLVKTCKTLDQAKVVLTLLDCIRNAVYMKEGKADVKFVTAGRGRGKSAALGLSIASALAYQLSNIFITAAA
jgi:N-acetyltransferase 10